MATCAQCSAEFTADPRQRYCTQLCQGRAAKQRAKQRHGSSRLTMPRSCEVCGAAYRPQYKDQRTCGRTCGIELRRRVYGHAGNRERPLKPGSQQWKQRYPSCLIYFPTCLECGKVFCARMPSTRICDKDCQRQRKQRRMNAAYSRYRPKLIESSHQNRARRKAVHTERVYLIKIYERDRWTCQLCGKKVRRVPRYKRDPEMASPDHIIPISLGGAHSYANLQCSHLRCNLEKHTRAMGEQLRLI